jgi:hypothetical protein
MDSGTDRMNELKYNMKIILVFFNTTLSNFMVTSYIDEKKQFVNTPITNVSNNIDKCLIGLYLIFLLYVFNTKRKQKIVQTIHYYMQQPFGKLLAAIMCSLMLLKIVIFIFGNMF